MRAAAPDALDGIQPPLDTGQMSFAWLLSLAGFSVATSITPGPNNMMLLASGVNFGFARSLRHVAGISFGFLVLLLAVGTGIGAALEAYPQLHRALTSRAPPISPIWPTASPPPTRCTNHRGMTGR